MYNTCSLSLSLFNGGTVKLLLGAALGFLVDDDDVVDYFIGVVVVPPAVNENKTIKFYFRSFVTGLF